MTNKVTRITRPAFTRARAFRKVLAIALITLLFSLALSNTAQAAAGDLDPSFGNGGKVTTNFSGSDTGSSIAVQTDGRIIAGGQTLTNTTGNDIALARYTGESFDICLQDDRVGSSLQINTTTGDYVFNNCDTGLTLEGRGAITVQGCVISLIHRTPDRSIQARINTCQQQGSAVVSTFSPGLIGFAGISDSATFDNTCACQ